MERWTPSPRELPSGNRRNSGSSISRISWSSSTPGCEPTRDASAVVLHGDGAHAARRTASQGYDDVPLSLGLLGQLVSRRGVRIATRRSCATRSCSTSCTMPRSARTRARAQRRRASPPGAGAALHVRHPAPVGSHVPAAEDHGRRTRPPDREAVLAALRAGDIGEAEARLDPAYAFDDALLAEPVSARADRARPWAARLEALVREEIRAGRIDPAVNLLRAGLEIDVLSFHRAAVAAALGRASSDAKVRAQLWRLDPAGLLDLASELPDIAAGRRRRAGVELRPRSRCEPAEAGGSSLRAGAVRAQISSGIAAAIRATLAERVNEFEYAPLIEARPDLITDEAVGAALDAPTRRSHERGRRPRGEAARCGRARRLGGERAVAASRDSRATRNVEDITRVSRPPGRRAMG